MNFQHGRSREEPEINLIPMIDVLLVIIIFLMLTTTYAKFSGLEINLPTADASKQAEQPNEVDVAVTATGQVLVNKSPLTASRRQEHRRRPAPGGGWQGRSADRHQRRRQGDAPERGRCHAGGADGRLSAHLLRHPESLMVARWLQRQWFEQRRLTPALWLLLPLAGLYVLLSALNRRLARPRAPAGAGHRGRQHHRRRGRQDAADPLAGRQLRQRGWRPGIVSRGYGRQGDEVRPVTPAPRRPRSATNRCCLPGAPASRSGSGRQRAAAGEALLAAHPEVDVVLCDDGLQHYGWPAMSSWRLRWARRWQRLASAGRAAARVAGAPATVDAIICQNLKKAACRPPCRFSTCSCRPAVSIALDDPQQTCNAAVAAGRGRLTRWPASGTRSAFSGRWKTWAGLRNPGRFPIITAIRRTIWPLRPMASC
jgi:tetraacyldisaccharide 4'-kinase